MSFVQNLGIGGVLLDARYGSTTGADTNDPLLLEHTGGNYLYLPGSSSSNNVALTNRAAYNPSTAFSVTVRLAADTYRPSATADIAQRTEFADPDRQWGVFVQSSGIVRLQIWPLGTSASFIIVDSTSAISTTDGALMWLRVSFNGNDGSGNRVTTFEVANDQATEPTAWSSLGTVTTAGTVTFSSVTSTTFIGVSANKLAGKYRRFIYRVDGTVQIDADFTTGITSGGQTTFTESSSNAATVTINRSTSGRKSVAVVRDVWLFGTDDRMEVPDSPLLDFSLTDSFTVLTAARVWGTTECVFVSKKATRNLATDAGWWTQAATTTLAGRGAYADGTNVLTNVAGPSATAGNLNLWSFVRDTAADTFVSNLNTTAGTPVTDTMTATLANSQPMTVGVAAGTAADMELLGVAVFRRALSATEIAAIANYYGAS
jgi:hypothetical protein